MDLIRATCVGDGGGVSVGEVGEINRLESQRAQNSTLNSQRLDTVTYNIGDRRPNRGFLCWLVPARVKITTGSGVSIIAFSGTG